MKPLTDHQMSKLQHKRFEELCELKLKVVEERNEIVMQTEEERVRELEEDETTSTMFDKRFGGGAIEYDGSSSDEGEYRVHTQCGHETLHPTEIIEDNMTTI